MKLIVRFLNGIKNFVFLLFLATVLGMIVYDSVIFVDKKFSESVLMMYSVGLLVLFILGLFLVISKRDKNEKTKINE